MVGATKEDVDRLYAQFLLAIEVANATLEADRAKRALKMTGK